jgi:Asp-tRNA(Asn)/Glu-tRNA(Gln) amidotransferase A subunit family amidase
LWSRAGGGCEPTTQAIEATGNTLTAFDHFMTEDPESMDWRIDLCPLEEYFEEGADESVIGSFHATMDKIRRALRLVAPLPLPASFHGLHERHRRVMAVDAAAYHRDLFARNPDEFGPNISSLIKAGLSELAVDYAEAVQGRMQFRDDMCDLLGTDTLAITPATMTTAPTLETTGDPGFNSPWSYAGLPTMTIPCGVDDLGLPCGFQIIGPTNSELRVLRAACICERALGFQQTPQLTPS